MNENLSDYITDEELERMQMWELFSVIMDIKPSKAFTALQLIEEIDLLSFDLTKKELNKLLFRLHCQNALLVKGKTANGVTIYQLNALFIRKNG